MKRSLCIFSFVLLCALVMFSSCASTSALEKNVEFSDFTMEDDLTWLQGIWKLEKWETDNHGVKQDNTNIYKNQFLMINGNQKTSELIEMSESSLDGSKSYNNYTVEDYFMLNSHESGHSNKVNESRTKLLLTREYALDPEVIFYFTYTKQ